MSRLDLVPTRALLVEPDGAAAATARAWLEPAGVEVEVVPSLPEACAPGADPDVRPVPRLELMAFEAGIKPALYLTLPRDEAEALLPRFDKHFVTRVDYVLDHDHSSYVDQWDWEQVISERDRNLHYLTDSVERIWRVLTGAENFILDRYPVLQTTKYQKLPERLTFIHSEDLLAHYPRLSRQERETEIAKECGAVFIYGIGWTLSNGFPHEMRAPDADDWVTETKSEDGRTMHGLNGHIIAWNSVTKRRHELSSMGIRVNRETLQRQLELTDRIDLLHYPYHQAVVRGTLPLSIGGGIGQSRTFMLLLRKAHLGEVSVSVWPKALKDMCAERRIHVLE